MVPKGDPKSDCKPPKVKIEGNTITYDIECKDKEGRTTTGNGKVTYKGTTFEGAMEMNMDHGGGQVMKMSQKMSGKRTGECSKAAKK